MAKYTIEDTTLTNIANAIRTKGGTTATLTPEEMVTAIDAITAGGGSTGGGSYPTELYYNAAGGQYYGPSNYQPFDVSNATTLTFKYDLNVGSYACPASMSLYLGYGVNLSSGYYTYKKIDSSTKIQKILSSSSTAVTAVEVTVDVTNYTTFALYTYFAKNSSSYSADSSLHIYDITIS